ncbi:aldehyde dehydrogenase family protein [Neptunomonas concharum]|uniref:Aldehyde dehydrogenase family protein n=1 Tax=Neptunomonas concharum TaxID=1031538 RepID=A0A5P1R9D2_9GAMM|nr:aldehyde dehydrogenase family protein [Neptunomonas concharum]QEQ96208.1 aldehyde dehydrogenase family protein [Neptunomonas concharum]
MNDLQRFYINGEWAEPQGKQSLVVINPATEQAFATIRLGEQADVEAAVMAARSAFESYSQTSKESRIALLEKIIAGYSERIEDLAQAISSEMGAPIEFARKVQVMAGLGHIKVALSLLKKNDFAKMISTTKVIKEPIGVCALITPWNWPLNQITCKVAPALAVGCTMVLKPSEVAPLSAHIFAEILHEAGVPAGVFNLVDGDGAGVGSALSAHPQIDMVSFTGSTRAGRLVSKAAADTVKKVSLELGGKSANIILDDADFEKAVGRGVKGMMSNSGQSCNALSRMLVPESRLAEVEAIARKAVVSVIPGDPQDAKTVIGPVVSEVQWNNIQALIAAGIDEGAQLLCGGLGKPEGLETGYYVKPTIFTGVDNQMTIAKEEIFGPVLCIIPYKDEAEAIAIANDHIYGLSGSVWSSDLERARKVASRLRTGMVHINGAMVDGRAPFGGYRQSGLGREWGMHGMEEFLEVKSMFGYDAS